MTTKRLLYVLLTFYHIMLNYSHCGFSDDLQFGLQSGCRSKLDEEKCVYEVYCVSYVDYSPVPNYNLRFNHNQCKRTVGYNGNYFVPVWLYYRGSNIENQVPQSRNNFQYISYPMLVLDVSFNNYYILPTIFEMANLEFLNVSHNNIATAKFSNAYNLKSLKEIDFSYNKIENISNNEDELIYRRITKLWLSNNQLRDLPNAIFNNFSELEYLDLSHNLITNVSLYTFEGIKELKILQLSHNDIGDLNLSLFRFNKLKELYLNNNKIKNILIRDFEKLNELEILDLRRNLIVSLEKDVFSNLVLLKQIDLSENLLTAIDKDTFSTIINLQSINLSKNELIEIPVNLFRAKNISFFAIEGNSLQGSLKRGIFEGLQLNTKLDMSYQSIDSIEDYAFFGLDNLIELLLNNNIIRSLSNKSFKTLQKLVLLDLSFNQITHIDFDKEDLLSLRSLLFHNNHVTQIKNDDLHNLQTLQFLDLSQNNISKIESKSFRELLNVKSLLVSKNPITGNLETNTFEGLTSVPKLDLSCTLLDVIMNASFDGMINLYDLNISHSKVRELQYDVFSNTGNIDSLDLSYNEIKIFKVNTTDLKNLKLLLLNNNLITALYSDMFKDMTLLNKILLSSNLIKSADIDTFKNQGNLRYLDLSYNSNIELNLSIIKGFQFLETLILQGSTSSISFKEFDVSSFVNIDISNSSIQNVNKLYLSKLKKLQSLHLSKNNVTQLEVGAFSNMSEIKEIDVSYNKINNIQPGVFKDNHLLIKLNISHNALLVLSYGALRGLINLSVLDISFNLISSLETERFYEVEGLQELIADHNRISSVSIEDFYGTSIKKLSIGDNPLPCEIVTKLKKASHSSIVITALRYIEDNEENIYGISCNNRLQEFFFNKKANEKQRTDNYNENVLTEIRDILLNLGAEKVRNEERVVQDGNLFNFTEMVQSSRLDYLNKLNLLNNVTIDLNEEQKTTNKLLERILKVVVATNSINKSLTVPVKDNITSENFIKYINKIRQDFDNAMILDKENILAELENKISLINKRIESIMTTTPPVPIPKNEKLSFSNEPKSFMFVETGVAFILLILICLVLYKVYKSRFYVSRRRSMSTNPISDAIDTSNV